MNQKQAHIFIGLLLAAVVVVGGVAIAVSVSERRKGPVKTSTGERAAIPAPAPAPAAVPAATAAAVGGAS